MIVTIFKDGYDLLGAHYISVSTALERIKNGRSKALIEEIRGLITTADPQIISKKKLALPSVLFHGKFDKEIEKEYTSGNKKGQKYRSRRDDLSISQHSGLAILDFDKCNVAEKKLSLSKDEYIYAAWVSPSGYGIKALVRIPAETGSHHKYYSSLLDRYPDADPTSRSISRLCYESYDPDIYINTNSAVWTKIKVEVDRAKEKLCVEIIMQSPSGQGHYGCLKAGFLAGGFTASGFLDEQKILQSLYAAARIRRPNEEKDSVEAINAAFRHGMNQPIDKLTSYTKGDFSGLDLALKSIFAQHKLINPESYIITRETITESSQRYNEGRVEKSKALGIAGLDNYLVFRDNSFYTITGGKGAGKSTTMLYLFTLDAIKNKSRNLMVMYENDHFEAEQDVIGFLCQNNPRWMYNNRRAEYNKAADFFHAHFTMLKIPVDFTIYDIFELSAKIQAQSKYNRLFIDPLFKVPETDDYAKNKKIAAYCQPFSQDVMSLYISMHPTGKAQREGGQPRDLDAEFGSMYSNAADITMTLARNYKSEDHSERNTVSLSIDKMRSKRLYGGGETFKDCPIRLEWMWKRHGYRLYVPLVEGGYSIVENPIEEVSSNPKEESFFANSLDDSPF